MFHNILGFGYETFIALVLAVSISISAHLAHGWGTRKAKEFFVGTFLLLMVCVQLYYLILAVNHIPSFPYTYDVRNITFLHIFSYVIVTAYVQNSHHYNVSIAWKAGKVFTT